MHMKRPLESGKGKVNVNTNTAIALTSYYLCDNFYNVVCGACFATNITMRGMRNDNS